MARDDYEQADPRTYARQLTGRERVEAMANVQNQMTQMAQNRSGNYGSEGLHIGAEDVALARDEGLIGTSTGHRTGIDLNDPAKQAQLAEIRELGLRMGLSEDQINSAFQASYYDKNRQERMASMEGGGNAQDMANSLQNTTDRDATAHVNAVGENGVLIANLAALDPEVYKQVDLQDENQMYNLSKPLRMLHSKIPAVQKELLTRDPDDDGWADFIGRKVLPALASVVIGAGALSQFGAFGGGEFLLGSSTVPGSAGLSGGAINAMEGAAYTPGGVAGGTGAAAIPESAAMGGGSSFAAELLGGSGMTQAELAAMTGGAGAGSVAGGIDEMVNAGIGQAGAGAGAGNAAGGGVSEAIKRAIDSGVVSKVGEYLVDNAGKVIGTVAAIGGALINDESERNEDTRDVTTNADPLSYEFWDSFVDEWMNAKDMYQQDDAYMKSKVEPAIGKYQQALADLGNQAKTGTGTYTPTTFGMGNFRSSFVPKSSLITADNLKGYAKEDMLSELAKTDAMLPNKANMQYLNDLMGLAKWQFEQNQARDLAQQGYDTQYAVGTHEPSDKGTWLDAVKDIIQIGDTSQDLWDKWFGKD